MAKLDVHQFPCLSDNYGVLIHDPERNLTAAIDAPEEKAVAAALAERGWRLTHILTTHHHGDHTAGNVPLKAQFQCTIIGPRAEAERVPGIDRRVGGGDAFPFGAHEVRVLDTPGHTAGHVSYWLPHSALAFVGDTLFAMGCGRVIEGNAETMWRSLDRLRALPQETVVYCGHEYTEANAKFALTIEPENASLQQRAKEVAELRRAGKPTLPTNIGIELATNPFLRPQVPAIRKRLRLEGAPDWQVFREIRERKNRA
jgi:hydroxyacylglutathione hydrolase